MHRSWGSKTTRNTDSCVDRRDESQFKFCSQSPEAAGVERRKIPRSRVQQEQPSHLASRCPAAFGITCQTRRGCLGSNSRLQHRLRGPVLFCDCHQLLSRRRDTVWPVNWRPSCHTTVATSLHQRGCVSCASCALLEEWRKPAVSGDRRSVLLAEHWLSFEQIHSRSQMRQEPMTPGPWSKVSEKDDRFRSPQTLLPDASLKGLMLRRSQRSSAMKAISASSSKCLTGSGKMWTARLMILKKLQR